MELLVAGIAIVAVAILASIPAWRYERRTGKKMGRGTAGAAFASVQELFQPSAANAATIVEEQKEARHALPSPNEPDFERQRIELHVHETHPKAADRS